MSKRLPLIVVLGATACGKSKLAIDIARRFGGEIISADSMQVYHGLDIVTNKVTDEEQALAKHHMINFLDPLQRYSVVDFRNKSLEIINGLLKKGILPILVGGTNYYIESILWKGFTLDNSPEAKKRARDGQPVIDAAEAGTLMDSELKLLESLPEESKHSDEDLDDVDKFFAKRIYAEGFTQIASEKLWNILEKVDPKSAHIYHPNDKRRVIRCLQVIQNDRQNYSELLESLNKSADGPSLGGPLRFESTCVLWLNCESEILDEVMDDRVDQMLSRGLLQELEKFHDDYNKQRLGGGSESNYDKGIFQTIGFKEFHKYLLLDPDAKKSTSGEKILREAINEMKFSTRKFAKRQLKWIRRRFLQSGTRNSPHIFKLNTTFNEDLWHKQVREPAFNIVESFVDGRALDDKLLVLRQEPDEDTKPNTPAKLYCDICDRIFIGSKNIEAHLKSKLHERRVKYAKKRKTMMSHDKISNS